MLRVIVAKEVAGEVRLLDETTEELNTTFNEQMKDLRLSEKRGWYSYLKEYKVGP